MVGVPTLERCDLGPSSRIGWPLPCFTRNRSMMPGPNSITNSSAVKMAPPVRKVMYLKTFSTPIWSLKFTSS